MNTHEAIKILRNTAWLGTNEDREKTEQAVEVVAEALEQEPKCGKWIDHTDEGFVECPFCHSATNCEGNIDELKFCFSCGARMESDEE